MRNENGLTDKQQLFADEYLSNDKNAKQAYKKYYITKNDNVAAAAAARLLSNVNVRTYVEKRLNRVAIKYEVTQDRIMKEYSRLAFFDPRKLFDEEGHLKHIKDLDEDTACAVAGFDFSTIYRKAKDMNQDEIIAEVLKKIKFADKKGSLDSLARINGMFVDKLEIKSLNVNINDFTGE